MKWEKFCLLASAAAAVALALVPGAQGGIFGLLSLPFVALSWLLQVLSLAGAIGSGMAIAVCALLCAVPLVFWWRGERRAEDWLLVLLSGVLALVLYFMVNPDLRQSAWQNSVGDGVYALPFWSTLVAWAVLRLIITGRVLEGNIYRALRVFLMLCAVGCLVDALGTELKSFLWYLDHYSAAQYAGLPGRGVTIAILSLRYMIRAAEGLLTVLVIFSGMVLLRVLEAEPFSEACVEAAEAVSRRCRSALVVITLSSLAMNLAQLLLHDLLINLQLELRLPVLALAVCFALLSVTRLLVQGKTLKDDNDLFV